MNPMVSASGLASGVQWHDLVDQIIAAEGARRVTPLGQQISASQQRITAWNTFKTLTSRLETAARKLQDGSAFDGFVAAGGTSSSTGRSVVTASVGASAAPGRYGVEVQQLARAEKLASRSFADAQSPLNVVDPSYDGGSITINGREVTIDGNDTLAQVRDRINASNTGASPSGVTASILTVGPGDHRLVLTSVGTGADGIRLVDGEPGALSSLGISASSRSVAVSDTTSSLAAVLGISSPPTIRTIVIGGMEITVDLLADSLQSVLDRIHTVAGAAGEDPQQVARLVSENGQSWIEVRGSVTGRVDDPETNSVLSALGFTREGLATAGTNAAFRIDGFDLTRRTNIVSDAVPGVTLSLQSAEPGTTVDLTVEADLDASVAAVQEFANAYNELLSFVEAQRAEGSPLARNSTLRSAMSSFTGVLLTPIQGLDTAFERAAQIGVSLSRTGQLTVDEPLLREQLQTRPGDVRALFAGRSGDDPVEGLATRMANAAAVHTRTGNGTVATQIDSIERSITSLTRRMADAEQRLEIRRESLIAQFTRMETALSALQAQGNWLTSQIDAMKPSK